MSDATQTPTPAQVLVGILQTVRGKAQQVHAQHQALLILRERMAKELQELAALEASTLTALRALDSTYVDGPQRPAASLPSYWRQAVQQAAEMVVSYAGWTEGLVRPSPRPVRQL